MPPRRDPLGTRALYSVPEPRPGTILVECSDCRARSRVGVLEFVRLHLPFWLWLPGRRFSRLLTCPACGRRTWLALRLRD